MKKTPRNTVNNMEEIKMVKYIVEAPEPKNGQKVSSGSWLTGRQTACQTRCSILSLGFIICGNTSYTPVWA